jgi:hypothetical protein
LTRHTQTILYYTLPIAFWLLAGLGSALPLLLGSSLVEKGHLPYFAPAVLTLVCLMIVSHIRRHSSSVEECFQVAVLLGIAAYWLPTVLLVIVPVWGYLINRNLFSFRSVLSSVIGFALVAVWMAVLVYTGILKTPPFMEGLGADWVSWIPAGAFAFAYIASKIARQNLRVR